LLIDKCKYTKLVSKPNEKNLKNVSTDASNTTTISKNKFKNKLTSKVLNKSHKKSIAKNKGNIFIIYLGFSEKHGFHTYKYIVNFDVVQFF